MGKERHGIHLIAEMANVSIGTVDRALHGRGGIKDATRQRILQIARQIGYTPNLAARALSVTKSSARIGVCMPREIHFFYDQLWSGVLDEAKRVAQLGIQFVHRPVQRLGADDAVAFKDLIQNGVDGIILTAGNPKELTPLIDDAEENGIPVVCVSTDAPESRRSCIVCVEPYLNGCLAGELMGKIVPPGSKVAVVAGMLTAEDHRKKTDGFSETFPKHCPGGKIAAVIEGHEDEDESFQKTFDLLRRTPSIVGLYVNTVNCLPVCRALGARGLAGKVRLITTDLFAEMSSYFQKRYDHRVDLPTATSARSTCGSNARRQPHNKGEFSAVGAPESGRRNVIKSSCFSRNENDGFEAVGSHLAGVPMTENWA